MSNINTVKELLKDFDLEMPDCINSQTLYGLLVEISEKWLEIKDNNLTTQEVIINDFMNNCSLKDTCCNDCEHERVCNHSCFDSQYDKVVDCQVCPKDNCGK